MKLMRTLVIKVCYYIMQIGEEVAVSDIVYVVMQAFLVIRFLILDMVAKKGALNVNYIQALAPCTLFKSKPGTNKSGRLFDCCFG